MAWERRIKAGDVSGVAADVLLELRRAWIYTQALERDGLWAKED